jgi:alpha-L-rhamnosidase
MGLLHKSDWKAQWIEPDMPTAVPEPKPGPGIPRLEISERFHPSPLLRKPFSVRGCVKRARIYATAHGVYRLELNGRRVGDLEFAPDSTSYHDFYLMVQTYDVTDHIVEGDNAIGVITGDGWYIGRVGIPGDSCDYGDMPALLLQLEIEYEDGRMQTVVSDGELKSSSVTGRNRFEAAYGIEIRYATKHGVRYSRDRPVAEYNEK